MLHAVASWIAKGALPRLLLSLLTYLLLLFSFSVLQFLVVVSVR